MRALTDPNLMADGLRVDECVFCDGHGKVLVHDVQQYETRRAQQIIQEVAAEYEITPGDITGRVRTPVFCEPRDKVMFRMREELGLEYKTIGWYLGKRDHSTILNGVKNHRARMKV